MSILTEKEREDVYRYWLKSTTLTDEDGLIQITERAVLERLAGMEMPEPEDRFVFSGLDWHRATPAYFNQSQGQTNCIPAYSAAQLHQAYAQGAASQLSSGPVGEILGHDVKRFSTFVPLEYIQHGTQLYTLKEAK